METKSEKTDSSDYVLGFIFNRRCTKVLLIEKEHPDWQKGKHNGIGGHIKNGEVPADAMTRECKEETDLYYAPERWEPFGEMILPYDRKLYLFRLFSDSMVLAKTMTDEEVSIVPINVLDTIPAIRNLSWLIPLALDNSNKIFTSINYITEKEVEFSGGKP